MGDLTGKARTVRLGFGSMAALGESRRFAQEKFLSTVLELEPDIGYELMAAGPGRVAEWAARWHLKDEWIHDVARFTLEVYDDDLKSLGEPFHIEYFAWPIPPDIDYGDADVLALDWAPQFHHEEDFRRRVAAFVERHIAKRKEAAVAAGLRALETEKKTLEPFTWLVQYQCLEMR